jgi:hypothetical protein
MDSRVICFVTIHGVGFQQPPEDGVPGYADDLHTFLCKELNTDGNVLLSDDPTRRKHQVGESVPIYVQSVWPPNSLHVEDGLMRLGSWDQHRRRIDIGDAPLVTGDARIAHVALVYSRLEGEESEIGATAMIGGMSTISARHYSHVTSLMDMMFMDILRPAMESLWSNLLKHPSQADSKPMPGLRIRQDKGYHDEPPQQLSGFTAILKMIENDVAAYICHNEKRQRVRRFVLDALQRLTAREDVSGIVLNTHSNGTVVGLDVVQELPPYAAEKIRAIITAGSPIRKYIDLFEWGNRVALVPQVERWWNFYDARDIVADRLLPDASWIRGTEPTADQLVGIYEAFDPCKGEIVPMHIEDILVHNVPNSPPGGLQWHDYWDNTIEFIPKVADLLKDVMAETDSEVS